MTDVSKSRFWKSLEGNRRADKDSNWKPSKCISQESSLKPSSSVINQTKRGASPLLEGVSIVRSLKNLSNGFNGSPARGRIISYSFAPQIFSQNRVCWRQNARFCSQDSCCILALYSKVIYRTSILQIKDQRMGQNLRLVLFSFIYLFTSFFFPLLPRNWLKWWSFWSVCKGAPFEPCPKQCYSDCGSLLAPCTECIIQHSTSTSFITLSSSRNAIRLSHRAIQK